jgi:hypothetical protein
MAEEEYYAANIATPTHHDILLGRGNLANRHPGNENFRAIVNSYKPEYVAAPKAQKGLYPKIIYDKICSLDPPGRFLRQDPISKLWSIVEKKKAIDKTRQALREGAPELLRGLEGKDISDISTSTSRLQEEVVDGRCSFNEFDPFQPIPHGHQRFLSDASIDITSMLADSMEATAPSTNAKMNCFLASPSEMTEDTGPAQVYSGEELSSMLRTAQMQMIQRHISEWTQLSNMRAQMQNNGFGDSQLQLQAIQIQMQLQNAWNETFQQASDGSKQQQSFLPAMQNDTNALMQPAATTYGSQIATSNSLQTIHQASTNTAANTQDFSALLAALQDNAHASNNQPMSQQVNQPSSFQAVQASNNSFDQVQQQPMDNSQGNTPDFSALFAALQNNASASSIENFQQYEPNMNQPQTSSYQQPPQKFESSGSNFAYSNMSSRNSYNRNAVAKSA